MALLLDQRERLAITEIIMRCEILLVPTILEKSFKQVKRILSLTKKKVLIEGGGGGWTSWRGEPWRGEI